MQRNILIVDDESSLRRTLAISLQQRGFATVVCENGINALKTLELHVKNGFPPDIMVVDIKLPDIDGIKGLRSDKIADIPGHEYGAEVVHRNNLVVL